MIKFLEKYPILSIILFVGTLLFPLLDAMDVTIMEARNFVTAREMLTENHWILTTNNGLPRYQKPPLPTWFSAVSASIFGIKSVWAMRLPAVLMVMLLGSMVFTLSRKLKLTSKHSTINGFISVTSLYVVLIAFEGPWDIYAHAFMIAGIYYLFQILQKNHNIKNWILAVVFIAASILSKGPVSLYALFLPFLISYLIVFRKGTLKKSWVLFTSSIIIAIIIGFAWYVYVRFADPEAFNAIAERETGNWTSRNVRPFYYYWSFFVQSGLWTIPAFISLLYPYMKSKVIHFKTYKFTLIWTLASVILLSIIPEKKSRYLMPVLIPLAINTGFYIEYLIRKFKNIKDRRETVPVYFNFGLLTVIFITLPIALSYFILANEVHFRIIGVISLILVFIIAILMVRSLLKRNVYRLFYLSVGAIAFTALSALTFIKDYSPNPNYTTFEDLNLNASIPFYAYERIAPTLIWNIGQKVPILSEKTLDLNKEAFYLLICENCDTPDEGQFSNFSKTDVGFLDINKALPDSKAYKLRKAGEVFLYKKKTK
ncbi:ArnT family glycosyltransferase [Dokdonia sp. Hel_I_53]|uniref:ArnT family glycosyltransferase n=1 Tax=Dokdonia sp. Hel_I_53 TaxID=1566287 RepID=UPI00119A0CB7|nr:glycosyltransferase family 39 protein [Dokdonia sp. Hel_I_53]TVZ52294.1 4-amino-4-deoxy-L-arabinose transferase-like glycosyltransferase [Dokdonia sp. Hel_I_53]